MAARDPEYMEDVLARQRAALLEAAATFNDILTAQPNADWHTMARHGERRALDHHMIGKAFRTALTPETSRYEVTHDAS